MFHTCTHSLQLWFQKNLHHFSWHLSWWIITTYVLWTHYTFSFQACHIWMHGSGLSTALFHARGVPKYQYCNISQFLFMQLVLNGFSPSIYLLFSFEAVKRYICYPLVRPLEVDGGACVARLAVVITNVPGSYMNYIFLFCCLQQFFAK